MAKITRRLKKSMIVGVMVLSQAVPMIIPAPITAFAAANGFHVSGTKLYDANGNEFVMRGINHAHAWYKGESDTAIPAIARTKANTVRVAFSNGNKSDLGGYDSIDNVKKLIKLCEDNKLIAVVEVHDTTGDDGTGSLDDAVNYWISMKDALKGHEDTVILNIGNEWHGTWDSNGWASGYMNAIPRLRSEGIKNTIMVDCAGYGQYPKSIADRGKDVFNSDPDRNTMFSIHMYEYAGGDSGTVRSNIDSVMNQGLALCIGEFGCKHTDGDVDEYTIMDYCQERGAGYIGWSWKGNGEKWSYLDLANDWNGNSLTDWGKTLLYSDNGIQNTSKTCSVFYNKPDPDPDPDPSGKIIAEAENGYKNGVDTSTSRSGYSGSGYVTGFDDGNDSVEVTVNAKSAGEYYLNVNYASEYGDKYTTLYVNGNNYGDKLLSQSSSFTDGYLDKVYLNAGENKIKLQSSWGYYDIDKFILSSTSTPAPDPKPTPDPEPDPVEKVTAEAEDGYKNGVDTANWRSGYSGSGYVTGFDDGNDSIEVSVNVPQAGEYYVNTQYASEYGDKKTTLYVNGNNYGEKSLGQSYNFTDAYLDTVYLNAGENKIKLQSNWGYYDIDNITVTQK